MIFTLQKVERRDDESLENFLRRFNRRVQQSGVLSKARKKQYYQKPLSRREKREIAIRKKARYEVKIKQIIRGI